jgi:uncharacterized DUF497 family protein
MRIFTEFTEFEWDQGNKDKNSIKHLVSYEECEEIFFDQNKKFLKDVLHSGKEERYIIVGKTKKERLLFIVFTFRHNTTKDKRQSKVRIISARDLNKKEKKLYE